MNTGQMMITLGALVLISFVVLRVNGSQLTVQDSMQNSKFGILAISLATSIIENATEKAYDEKSTEDFLTSLSQLTARSSFGIEGGEDADSVHTFDDFDDFHSYSVVDTSMPSAHFQIDCAVNYVDPYSANFITGNTMWHKMLTITITSPSMTDTVRMNKIYSYWKLP
ncbi:MAG: hypothetical protein KJO48_12615 [Ignavibacteria bacterium]|nr:hypothetical protein [Ignavibacteria bacterium]